MKRRITAIGLSLLLAAVASCNRTADRPSAGPVPSDRAAPATTTAPAVTGARTESGAAPAPHGLQDDQLRALMKLIAARTQQDWPENVPRPLDDQQTGELARAIESARKLSAGLAPAAERIPMSVERLPMSDADRAGFNAEAGILRDQAMRLGDAARARDTVEIQKLLDGISSTCISCHSRYRDIAGQLDLQLAAAAVR